MKNINWKVRFNKNNMTFISRFALALLVPVLGYLGLKFEDLTSWQSIGDVLVSFVSNPYLIFLTIANAVNLLPDPTTKGIGDSEQALSYKEPK